MWLSSMLLLLLMAVSISDSWFEYFQPTACYPRTREIRDGEVHCIRVRGQKSIGRPRHGDVCSLTIENGYAEEYYLDDCYKRRNGWYECPCKKDWTRCVETCLIFLKRKYKKGEECQKELIYALKENITSTRRPTKTTITSTTTTTTTTTTTVTTSTTTTTTTSTTTTTTRPTTTTTTTATTRTTPSTISATKSIARTAEYEPTTTHTTWPIIVYTSGALEVMGTTSEHSATASRSTDGTDMISEGLSPYRAAKIEARKKAALRLLILSSCMFCVLLFQLMFIRMLRNIHRQLYDQYVQNCLRELRAKETTSSEDSKRSTTSVPKSKDKPSGGFFTKIKRTAESTMVTNQLLKSQLPTFQWKVPKAPASDDETVTDFYASGNNMKK